ncbi:MAG: tol-pal system protein YbgF [Rhodobacteraceae bacterium]|jgi:tol-pal system protein YbgF|uniref:tol-pal system protein YbgF n=1 Tax=Thioclava marina TaxID=1915077 RepID=UPI0030811BC5|nr:MAG: tol-pal system protein YbgF [Paracoccaceae bacterium]
MLRALLLSAAVLSAAPVLAQDANRAQTLADIKTELGQLQSEIDSLRQELKASGAAGLQKAGGASALQRMDSMELSLSHLTDRVEGLENRINRVVADGTNRVGDLEYRVCEMEDNCDISTLGATKPLGGGAAGSAPSVTAPAPDASTGPDLAINEKADYDAGKKAYDAGDYASAADLFNTFKQTYPGSPLTGDAMYYRGLALQQQGDTGGAARSWLDGFSADPSGARAGDNLLSLGKALGQLGQTNEACTTLGQVGVRFPGSSAASEAQTARQSLGCP